MDGWSVTILGGEVSMYYKLWLVLFVLFAAFGAAGASRVHAQEIAVYPPLAPCIGLSTEATTFWFEGDNEIAGYLACDVTGLSELGDYVPSCPSTEMTFDLAVGGCYFSEQLPDGGSTGGHQPWRDGQRGRCESWMDGYACSLWQEGYNFPDENGECPSETTLIPGDASGLGVATCQTFNEEDGEGATINTDNDEAITITGNGSESTEVLVLPNTGAGSVQDANGLIILILAGAVILVYGCALRCLQRS